MTSLPTPRLPPSLAVSMALQYAVGGALLPFVAVYLADRGLETSSVGYILLGCSGAGSCFPFLWGYLADAWVRVDRLLAVLHVGGAAALFAFAHARAPWGLGVSLVSFFALYQPTTALLHGLLYHNLARPDVQFAGLRLWGSVGWMLPSLPIYLWLAWGPAGADADLSFVVYLAAALELATAMAAVALPATPPAARRSSGGAGQELTYSQALGRLFSRPGFGGLLAVIFLAYSSFAILFYYSPPFLVKAGFDKRWIGPLQCLGVMVEIPLFFLLPRIIAAIGYGKTIVLGCAMLFLRQVLYASEAPRWLLASSYVCAGACVALYITGVSLSLNAMADRAVRVTAQTLFALLGAGLGQMFGHQSVAWIARRWSGNGLRIGFVFASATAGAALLILAFGVRGKGLFSMRRVVRAEPAVEPMQGAPLVSGDVDLRTGAGR